MNRHKVRHLPVTVGGRAVGMVSSRNLIDHQVRTSQAKQHAAEQVAMLSTSLRNLDFDNVVSMIVREVPRIFSAGRAVACLGRKGGPKGKGAIVKTNHCLCPQEELRSRRDLPAPGGRVEIARPPAPCRRCKAGGCKVLIPINLSVFSKEDRGDGRRSYVCMCGLPHAGLQPEVLAYKAALAREVISYNLSHARLFLEAKSLVLTDSLTGAGTRKVLETAMEAETARSTATTGRTWSRWSTSTGSSRSTTLWVTRAATACSAISGGACYRRSG